MSTCSKCGTSYPSHVKFCTRDGAVLEDDVPVEAQQIGKVIAGKYRLDAYISKGGMGSVYCATHLMLEKQVALKVIKPELVGSSEFVRRFQREARAATSLNHPHIVSVYDLGQAEDGTLYIAMEFVDGLSLKEAIKTSGPMDPTRIARLMRQMLSALGLAHRHRIVHRDLKPQNIMLTTDRDGSEMAKLVDFGIAKTFDDRTQLTATGFAIGTPQYMAPEQAAGTDVDGRSDLYSLGIILYEMLVAEVPFNDPSTPAILVKHLTEIPVRPSQRRTDLTIHKGLEDVAVKCLEKDPGKRFQTAEEIAQAISAAVPEAGGETLPMAMPLPSMASTRTATPVAAVTPPASAPQMSAPQAPSPAAPVPVPPVPVAAPASAAPAAAAALPRPAAAPVVRTGRSSLALAVGALAIVALAGMGFAVHRFTGSSTPTSQQSALPAVDAPTPAKPAESGSPNTGTPAAPSISGTPTTPSPNAASRAGEAPAKTTAPGMAVAAGDGAGAASANRSRDTRQPTQSSPSGARKPAQSAVPTTFDRATTPPAQPAAPSLPDNPTILLRCDGAQEVCGAIRDAFGPLLERERMTLTSSAPRADVFVVVNATAVDGQVQQQFGTTFVVRNYAINVELEAPKLESAPSAPASRNFSADLRVGRERINENARLVASDTVQKIREFWTRRRSAGD